MKTCITILSLLLTTGAFAQRVCGTNEYVRQLSVTNPAAAHAMQEAEQQIAQTLKLRNGRNLRDTSANELITIPVVVHIIYKTAQQNISDAQVLSQLEALNKDFSNSNADAVNRPGVFAPLAADVRIRFCLAQVDPNNKRTTGIIRKATSFDVFATNDAMKSTASGGDDAWDSRRYLNIWVCNLGGRSLGYATLPGGPADKDGVVISFDVFGTTGALRVPFNKGRTATHEVGHWLGLKHVWGDQNCGDDDVDDTPKQKSYNFGCPSFPHVTECSQDANGDMFMNYMDFSDDGCMNMFTVGQKKRMRALFATGNLRNSFLSSFACDSTLVQGGPVGGDTTPAPVVTKTDLFKVYPNPVQSQLTIEYKPAEEMQVKAFSIYNTTGVRVYSGTLTKEKNTFSIATLPAGLYIVNIITDKSKVLTKILKQ